MSYELSYPIELISCTICERKGQTQVEAEYVCEICNLKICKKCEEEFHSFLGHKTKPIQSSKLAQLKIPLKQYCKSHKKKISLYCRKCKKLLCYKCAINECKTHPLLELEQASELLLKNNTPALKDLKSLLISKKTIKRELETEKELFEKTQNLLIKEINNGVERIIQRLFAKQEELTKKIQINKQNKFKEYEKIFKQITEEINIIDSFYDCLNDYSGKMDLKKNKKNKEKEKENEKENENENEKEKEMEKEKKKEKEMDDEKEKDIEINKSQENNKKGEGGQRKRGFSKGNRKHHFHHLKMIQMIQILSKKMKQMNKNPQLNLITDESNELNFDLKIEPILSSISELKFFSLYELEKTKIEIPTFVNVEEEFIIKLIFYDQNGIQVDCNPNIQILFENQKKKNNKKKIDKIINYKTKANGKKRSIFKIPCKLSKASNYNCLFNIDNNRLKAKKILVSAFKFNWSYTKIKFKPKKMHLGSSSKIYLQLFDDDNEPFTNNYSLKFKIAIALNNNKKEITYLDLHPPNENNVNDNDDDLIEKEIAIQNENENENENENKNKIKKKTKKQNEKNNLLVANFVPTTVGNYHLKYVKIGSNTFKINGVNCLVESSSKLIDHFETITDKNSIILTNNKKTVTLNKNIENGAVMGQKLYSKGKYNINFRIDKCTHESGFIHLGVIAKTAQTLRFNPNESNGSCLYGLWNHNRGYGNKCKNGDLLTMLLNMEDRCISYKINDIDYGVAFINIPKKLQLFIHFFSENEKITLESIEEI
ncbi:tripartite motif-containing 33 [Anaeramoeba flamelloides]|uniref:Tripartite motif-containing 33 n=1 Tax=Anaeramoeba flamelloides TaxID=1746091 RepID=A0ABQ8Y9A2_9EUKA|nr:tripartite motif-containing 33 [Anaeramoeba flamelloides]